MSVVSDIFAGGVSGVLEGVGKLALDIRAAVTGKTALSSEDQIKLLTLANQAEQFQAQITAQLTQAQLDINKVEASSSSMFVAGWRPGVGWVCTLGLFYTVLLKPLLPWIVALFGKTVAPLPDVDMGTVTAMLGGLLGIGTMRTVERIKGKA